MAYRAYSVYLQEFPESKYSYDIRYAFGELLYKVKKYDEAYTQYMKVVEIDPKDHWATMKSLALAADAGPWESLWVYDHFHTVPEPTEEATHEAWTLVSAFAATTSRVDIGQMCTAMSYRNPAYLAKVAATTDLISGGRVQMGIGGGWYEHEWRAYGYGFPTAGVRLGRLDEGVQIMRDAWREGVVSFDGKHYQVDGAIEAIVGAAVKDMTLPEAAATDGASLFSEIMKGMWILPGAIIGATIGAKAEQLLNRSGLPRAKVSAPWPPME